MTESPAPNFTSARDLVDIGIHPVADLFPMLADDELEEMAADIKARGLLQPIVLDSEGRILDGRNRFEACKRAGVEPTFTTYEGDDPDGYALSVNIARRHLTKGQQAMVIARAARLFNLKSQVQLAAETGIPNARFSQAKTIVDFAPDFTDAVIAGTKPLNEAYEVARERKKAAADADAAMSELRAEAPDLADQVVEEQLSFSNALANLAERRREAHRQEEEARRLAELRERVAEIDAIRDADGAPPPSFSQRAESGSITWDEAATLAAQWLAERRESIQRDRARVESLLSGWGVMRSILDHPDSPYYADLFNNLGERDRQEVERITNEWRSRNGA